MERAENNIRKWLLAHLDRRGWTISEFVRMVGVTRALVYQYFNDRCRPTEDMMRHWCNVLGVPHDEGLAQYTPKPFGRPKKPEHVKILESIINRVKITHDDEVEKIVNVKS